MTIEARAQRNIHGDSIDVWLFDPAPGIAGAMALPLVFKTREVRGEHAEPAMRLAYKTAQELMDEAVVLRPAPLRRERERRFIGRY
jgi:hypothetical protein